MPYNEFQKIVDEIVQSDIVVLEEYSTENGYDENFDVTDIHITGSRKHYFTHELKYDNGVEKTLTLPAMKFLSVRTWDKVRDYIRFHDDMGHLWDERMRRCDTERVGRVVNHFQNDDNAYFMVINAPNTEVHLIWKIQCKLPPKTKRFCPLKTFNNAPLKSLDRWDKIISTMTTKIANILQCYALGMGIKQISRSFELSRNTVRRYVRLFQECGIPIKELAAMPSARIQEMFSEGVGRNREPSQRQLELEALLPEYAARLSRRGVTVKTLYEEYRETHPDGYRHASFGNYLMRYRMVTHVVGHVEHYAGDQMYIDFAGDKLEVVDSESGECRSVEVFVAILPCSHYTYCEAVWSQSRQDLIKACENALHFYGGVPMAIVPDNLKSAVTRSDRNEPVINEEFAAFAEHYGCTVYPTRVRHPKDKALVENAVKLLYRSVYADIEGLVFHSLESLNAAISESLSAFNGRRMSGRPQSRREQFEQIESDCLRPLPAIRHQMKERRSATVMRNGYVTFRLHHYSVPKEYIGKRVEIVYDADTLEIYHGLRLVTTHQRDDTPYSYTTKDAHGLPGRHGSYEKDLEQIYERAGQTDNVLLLYLRKVAELKKYPPAAFRSCRGIMALEKTFGLERLVAASACATQLRLYGYQEIRRILERGDDADFLSKDDIDDEVPVTSIHKNIRGAAYFAQLKHLNRDNNGNK